MIPGMDFSFLMCSERSGSNLLLRMLDAHPEICGPPPTHLIRLLAENLFRYGDLQDEENWLRLLGDAADIMATKLGCWATDWPFEKLAAEVPRGDPGALVRHIYAGEALAQGKRRVFIKENHLYRFLPFVQQAFPGWRIVFQVRDPRDMCLSWKRSPILRGDVVRAAGIWREDQTRGRLILGCLGPARRIHFLAYEDLVTDPAGELAAICGFLDVAWSQRMLDYHRQETGPDRAPLTDDWKNLRRPVMATNFGKYRQGLSRTELAYVETVCREPMTWFGYEPETADELSRGELEAELLPRERRDKPGWRQVPQAEKDLRRSREAVVRRLTADSVRQAPVGSPVHA